MFADQYWRGDYERRSESDIPPALKPSAKNHSKQQKESRNEHDEAIAIAHAILKYNGIHDLRPLQDIVDKEGNVVGWETREEDGHSGKQIVRHKFTMKSLIRKQ